ncbi:MAG: extracellular solute-binding protein [Clostridia bacterium]|nr:extracellular solute-binding protein [Clostridia bacterium]
MKKILALLLTAMMALSMFSFASASALAGEYDVTIWVAQEIVETTKAQVEAFNASNTDGIKINATIEAVSEADAATLMITDVEAGGDLYCFAQDQFARLVQAGALAKLGAAASDFVVTNNAAGVVAAAKSGDALYAYPLTADNGYFIYYDKRVVS